ncbi:MAG: tRNA 2-thiouridine(34) synthase MnmA [Candidatus Omnitrophota bacterium]
MVAMSGGVDSSVSALVLIEKGFQVEGVTMPLSGFMEGRHPGGVDPVEEARRVCQVLGIPHHEIQIDPYAQRCVVDYFVQEYLKGRTPNPCIQCNMLIKFKELFKKVRESGAGFFATGHYARIEDVRGEYQLKKGTDPEKDQSYFLYGIDPGILPEVLFPVGGMVKQQVRQLALSKGLPCADRKESQDICFIPEGDYKDFLKQKAGAGAFVPGIFKDHTGKTVGEHQGIGYYTIGQRERLGIALGYPAHVYRISPDENTIYVGPRECLLSKGFTARNFKSLGMNLQAGAVNVSVKIRYNAPDVPAKASSSTEQGEIRVDFARPQESVTPGQSAVFFDGDRVLGGAVIEASF